VKDRTVGFVCGGRITTIFLEALGGKGLDLERVTVSDTGPEVLGNRIFFDPGRIDDEVADLVPVRPRADAEPRIRQAYSDTLGGLYRKLTGA
jgi:hypothetical protein